MLCHVVLLYRTKSVLSCIMLYCSLEQKVFWVVSCCLDYDTNLILTFSETVFDLSFCHAVSLGWDWKLSRQHSFMLCYVVLLSRTKSVLVYIILYGRAIKKKLDNKEDKGDTCCSWHTLNHKKAKNSNHINLYISVFEGFCSQQIRGLHYDTDEYSCSSRRVFP